MFTLRFDMRSSVQGAPFADLYAAALDMCAYSETRGGVAVILSEHHAAKDGHLPSPLMLASAIAGRTERIAIMLAALVVPLYNPVRLAEDIAVLDIISKGRAAYVLGVGHRDEEYEHLGVNPRRRGRLADEYTDLVLRLLSGETVTVDGRRVHVTPAVVGPNGPQLMIAGGSPAAVKRAARHGLGFVAQANPPGLLELFESESRAHGHEPGPTMFPDNAGPTTAFVADDVDAAWAEIGPYLLHDALMAASYRRGDDSVASITSAKTVAELRDSPGAYAIFTPDEAATALRSGRPLPLHPLCGGLPPALAWPYLERAAAAEAAVNQ
ncbi:MAG: LLM class flavin-dependent oxidoreductase [Mycobacterium sp.]|uniref:LLM class flavin-dependent oxidoreductase n=1 Tax=Mycobacterium sp. TaxID=1785 RepID=UPI001EB53845|nr:LLM class flavin-dependent oxidoreductase [Mycobacterium sp.]MBW0018360.1 LLM class flavin-dependent oxidoreductase [Mycobacterium sp.]